MEPQQEFPISCQMWKHLSLHHLLGCGQIALECSTHFLQDVTSTNQTAYWELKCETCMTVHYNRDVPGLWSIYCHTIKWAIFQEQLYNLYITVSHNLTITQVNNRSPFNLSFGAIGVCTIITRECWIMKMLVTAILCLQTLIKIINTCIDNLNSVAVQLKRGSTCHNYHGNAYLEDNFNVCSQNSYWLGCKLLLVGFILVLQFSQN